MVSISFLTFFLLMIVIVQATPSHKIASSSDENKSSKNNKQPYEIYKAMRVDPQLASVSNKDLVSFIYQHFIHGNNDDIDSIKQKYLNQQHYIQQQQQQEKLI